MGSRQRPSSAASLSTLAERECEVLVIGASAAGIAAAQAAALQGAQVLLLDRSGALEGLPDPEPAFDWLPDHTALELLLDPAGAVRGAAGVSGAREAPWRIVARAVVIASTDALLQATEAGALLAGMETGRGGLRLRGDEAQGACTVDGLYAAGAAAWSSAPAGTGLPQGTHAQALLSGQQAGAAAAGHALLAPATPVPAARLRNAGLAGLHGKGPRPANPLAVLAAVQAVLAGLGPDTQGADAAQALARLDALWQLFCHSAPAPRGMQCATRAAVARLALARWQLHSLLMRRAGDAAQLGAFAR